MRVFTLFLFLLDASIGLKAGIYVDNGFDQTTIDHDLTEEERMGLELEILHVLGLPTKPTKIQKSLKKSTLKYLMDMYDFLNKETLHHRSKRSIDTISIEKQMAIEDSDMIMTFDSVSDSRAVPYEKGRRLWFNMSKMPVAEDVVNAELRVFQKWVPTSGDDNDIFIVAVHELEGGKQMKFISSVTTTRGSSGWLSINLTSWILTWVLASGSTKGLYVVIYPATKPGPEMRPEVIGLTMDEKYTEIQPFVVVFFRNINHVYHQRSPRDVGLTNWRQSDSVSYPSFMKSSKYPCRIHTLYISFKDLRWHNWIIAPDGYSAFYCAGECRFPLTNHMNATSHALVQSWVHYMYPDKFPRPSCGPTETLPLYLIYQQADNAALQKRKDMVVRGCGCL